MESKVYVYVDLLW